jgi:hypothetical protein
MFIVHRRVSAVAAGLAVALLTVIIDNSCQSHDATAGASLVVEKPLVGGQPLVVEQPSAACVTPGACGIVRAGS